MPTDLGPLRAGAPADVARLLPMMVAFNASEGITVDPELPGRAVARLLDDPELGRVWFIHGPHDDGRDQGPTTEILKGVATSGTFKVSRGLIVKNDTTAPSRRDPAK